MHPLEIVLFRLFSAGNLTPVGRIERLRNVRVVDEILKHLARAEPYQYGDRASRITNRLHVIKPVAGRRRPVCPCGMYRHGFGSMAGALVPPNPFGR